MNYIAYFNLALLTVASLIVITNDLNLFYIIFYVGFFLLNIYLFYGGGSKRKWYFYLFFIILNLSCFFCALVSSISFFLIEGLFTGKVDYMELTVMVLIAFNSLVNFIYISIGAEKNYKFREKIKKFFSKRHSLTDKGLDKEREERGLNGSMGRIARGVFAILIIIFLYYTGIVFHLGIFGQFLSSVVILFYFSSFSKKKTIGMSLIEGAKESIWISLFLVATCAGLLIYFMSSEMFVVLLSFIGLGIILPQAINIILCLSIIKLMKRNNKLPNKK
ncbi:MAG: hypothetical protein PHW52_02145, partial [Candidatus Pacebacteria bacterium]|nr:hypothetical protein [Candidatus Paceibacterota bacterium]